MTASFVLCLPPGVGAHTDHADAIEELTVYGRAEELIGSAQTGSEGVIGYDDFQLPPLLRVGELVESIPGVVATQHSGTGKANQFFVRGFNLDHGTDLSIFVDGVPINMRTHGHGQGYLDLNFMIPELVETMTYRKGTSSASVGDFSAAASAAFETYDVLPESVAAASLGEHNYWRGLAATSLTAAGGTLTAALDVTGYDGPWELPENLRQTKFYVGYGFELGAGRGRITVQGYDGQWDSTDQIPTRAVQSGCISERGYIDPDLGGKTQRYALTGALEFPDVAVNVYVVDYDFGLYSNFTYFLDNPLAGDQFEQLDRRTIYGGRVSGDLDGFALAGRPLYVRWGADVRHDAIREVALFATSRRVRRDAVVRDAVDQSSVGGFLELEVALTERLRAVGGLRADYFRWDVQSLLHDDGFDDDDVHVSPKFSVSYQLTDSVEAYASYGRGFHSNDVRGTSANPRIVDPVEVFVSADGAELGLRAERGRTFNATLVGFWLTLDSELIYVGDAGTTEPNGATDRLGAEATVFWQANDWLSLNAAYTYTRARFERAQSGGTHIPGAIPTTFTFGTNAVWGNGLSASARVRWLDGAPLTEDGAVEAGSSLLVNAGIGYRRGRVEWRLEALNVFDSNDVDISYYYRSRLSGEPPDGVDDVHYHPLEPRSLRASVLVHW